MLAWRKLTAVLLALPIVAQGAHALGGDCPNEMATQVPVSVEFAGRVKKCGLGIVIFGVGGGIAGDTCPKFEIVTPAHQECQGTPAPNKFCEKQDELDVRMRQCKCTGLIIPFIKIGVPTECECGDWSTSGTVEDFETFNCVQA